MPHLKTSLTRLALEKRAIDANGFSAFARYAWPHIEQNPLVWGWHLEEICQELERIARLRHRIQVEGLDALEGDLDLDLAIMVPPGSTKSRICSILWQAWVWTWWPQSQWITSAYDDGLAIDFSRRAKDLVLSDWYQQKWPLLLTKESDGHWVNIDGGLRVAVGIGSRIHGLHGHFVLGDDLLKEQLSRLGRPAMIAEAVRKATVYWFGTLSTRTVDGIAGRVLIQQCLHIDDPANVAVRDHGYEEIRFPARFDPARPDKRDHRKEEGELLHARMHEAQLAKLEKELGPIASAAQLGQRPGSLGGSVLAEGSLSHRYVRLPSDLLQTMETGKVRPGYRWLAAWDLAFKGQEHNSRVAWVLLCKEIQGARIWLIDAEARHMGFLESVEEVRSVRARYHWVLEHSIEDAANASALEDTLCEEIPGLILVPHGGGTLARCQRASGMWKAGDIWLPQDAAFMGGSNGFIAEHAHFDGMKTRSDDYVSASSLGILELTAGQASGWAEAFRTLKE